MPQEVCPSRTELKTLEAELEDCRESTRAGSSTEADYIDELEKRAEKAEAELEQRKEDMTELFQTKGFFSNEKKRFEAEVKTLKEQNEKMFRKFKRIPATIADAYNTNVELESRLAEAKKLVNEWRRIIKSVKPPSDAIGDWRESWKTSILTDCANELERALKHLPLKENNVEEKS